MKGPKNRNATSPEVELRVTELVRIRLDGAQFWDVREYVREKEREPGSPWFLIEGRTPLSDTQLGRYIQRADKAIQRSVREKRGRVMRRHLARRENLYAKAVNAGDVNTALAVLRDDAKLRGLYEGKRRNADLEAFLASLPPELAHATRGAIRALLSAGSAGPGVAPRPQDVPQPPD